MHQSSYENMQKCFERYVLQSDLAQSAPITILDVGGADVNGSYSDIFAGDQFRYLGADLKKADGVSIVLEDPNVLPLDDESIDIVISGQMLEHCANFWVVFSEMVRVLKSDGVLFLIAPSAGPIHRYPVDCYRFYPDAYVALADFAQCHLVDSWLDDRGPWNDLVGVFSKAPLQRVTEARLTAGVYQEVNSYSNIEDAPAGRIQGVVPYLDVLESIHVVLEPRSYLEIGVRFGRSLNLARCIAVGVDPDPASEISLDENARIVRQTSDQFFENSTDPILNDAIDFIFVDGMHLFEYALRDFMNAEKASHKHSAIIIDDVLPNESVQAERKRASRVWTGDVWKLVATLRRYRPDLVLTVLDTEPSGMLLVTGLDPTSRILWDQYNPIVREAVHQASTPDQNILNRTEAIDPRDERVRDILARLKTSRNEVTVS